MTGNCDGRREAKRRGPCGKAACARKFRGLRFSAAAVTALSLSLSGPFAALAASPDFAYTAEKWASLQDNTLEYGEIADLIHEYNTTVQKNLLDYNDYKGKSSYDISKDYYDSANEMLENIEYPEDDSANYGSQMSSALNSQLQADTLTESGDNNVDDGDIKKWGYDQEEASLVKEAQELMIQYWSQTESLESLEEAVTRAENSYAQVQTQLKAGTTTKSQSDTAAEAVEAAKASLESAKSSLEQTKEKLIMMLGWEYGDEVVIGELPEADTSAVDAIDLDADIQTAQANNYDLRITERRISNAQSFTIRETQQRTYDNQKNTISTSVKTAYDSLTLAKTTYEQAKESYRLAQNELETAKTRLAAGTITKNTYQSTESQCLTAKVTMETDKLSYLTAKLDYDWCVNGLASAS